MSEQDLLSLTRLRVSPREGRLRRMATLITLLVAASLLSAAIEAGSAAAAGGSAIAAIAAVLCWRPTRPIGPVALRIDARGSAYLSFGDMQEESAVVSFLAPWLMVLRSRGRYAAIWPDQIPADHFRRASAVLRWTPPRTTTDSVSNALLLDADR